MTPVSGVIFSISIALGVHLTTFYTNLSRTFAAWQDSSWLHGLWRGAEGKLIKLFRKSTKLTIKIAISQSGITPLLRSFLRLRRLLRSRWGDAPATASLLDKLTLTCIQLPDDAIYVPTGRKTPIGEPGWASMVSVVDGSLTPVPWIDLDPAMVQETQRENGSYTLDVLKKQLRPRDAVETTSGGDEYVVSDTAAPNSPCCVSNPDVV